MRVNHRIRVLGAILVAFALLAAACGDDDSGGDTTTTAADGTTTTAATETTTTAANETTTTAEATDGPTITVASFNFPESAILAEIYAQALENAGYPVEKKLNLGSRELIFPSLENGELDLLPEYLGSALGVGFGVDSDSDSDSVAAKLADAFVAYDVTVLDYSPGEDKNVFVVTGDAAAANGLSTVSDLKGLDPVTLGGPPECEERDTCYLGLVDTYGITQLGFESYQEGAARIAALKNGEIDVALLFSTQPVIAVEGFVALEDDMGLIRAENIVPVIRNEVLDAYGAGVSDLLNAISAKITTEALIALNGFVEIDAEDPEDVATAWLQENGFLG